ncbi:MAG TPA: beta-propeller fold lactonase family protein [Terriglobales bacterium]
MQGKSAQIRSADRVRTGLPRKAVFAFAVLLILALAACGGGIITSPASHLLFVSVTANNTIAGYRVDNNSGAFTALTGSPYFAGNSPASLVLHPSGNFLYAVNQLGNNISLFNVNTQVGSITEVLPRTPTEVGPVSIVMNATGTLLFCSNVFSTSISVYAVNGSTGALTQVSGSPFKTYSQPGQLVVTPSGKFLYTINSTISSIVGFAVSSTGALQALPVTPAPYPPTGATIDPQGKYLIVINPTQNAFTMYFIHPSTGALTTVPGTPLAAGTGPIAASVQPDEQYVYIANQTSNNLSGYSIDQSTGTPTEISGSPFTVTSGPLFMQWDPNGEWLYVGGQSGKTVSEYEFSADGTITSNSQSFVTVQAPTSIAVGH